MTSQRQTENQTIRAAYQAMGLDVVFGNGGGWVKGRGFRTLAAMRKETGVNMAAKRGPRMEYLPGGDYATLVAITGGRLNQE